ncbi:hypothetical protein M3Y98_00301700 [Aphelenchoides besseyi]|nr:hypothetical protein M3Y98_00301700 [Aphelenchoides besseyi]
MVALQAYLLYLAFIRYQMHTEIKWPNKNYPELSLTIYASLCIACIPILFLFTLFGICKTGNLAGDHYNGNKFFEKKVLSSLCLNGSKSPILKVRIMSRKSQDIAIIKSNLGSCLCRVVRSLWRHCPPVPESLHVLAALCQVVAQQIMIAQLYRYGFINSGDFLNTELDFAYQRSRQLATNLPMGDTRLQGFRITTDELAGSPLAPNLLPILMHARLFGIPLEFVNLIVALMAYSSAYASVFWNLNKLFSLLFTMHLITHSVDVIYTYLSFSVLYRIQETNFNSLRPVGLGQYLAATSSLLVYNPLIILTTFVVTILCMHFTPIALYAYGYNKYIETINSPIHVQPNSMPVNVGLLDEFDGRSQRSRTSAGLCCDDYASHLFAIILLFIILIVKGPSIYALLLLYQHDEQPFFFSCIIIDVIYLFFWLSLWFFLTIKREWNFKLPKYIPPYKPNLSGTTNPPAPSNLFDSYRRAEVDEKNASVYRPGSYASIRRPLRPAGLVFAHGTESNDYTTFDKYAKTTALRASPTKYNDVSSNYGCAVFESKTTPQPVQLQHQTSTMTMTRPIISGTYEQNPVLWGLQHSRQVNSEREQEENGTVAQGKQFPIHLQPLTNMTPSSTLTSQNSNPSTFNQDPKPSALLNVHESTTTLTTVGGSQFATSVV